MASSNLLTPEILLLIAMHLRPQDQLSFLRAIPSFTRSFSARHLESKDETGNTILHLLAEDNESSLFIDLVSSCRGPNLHPQNQLGRTPLMNAIIAENSTIIRFLIENDPDGVNISDVEGATPLVYAIEQGCTIAATLLLQHPLVDVKHRNRSHQTPLLFALHEQIRLEVTEEILRHPQIDLEEVDGAGKAPLILAAYEGCEKQVRIMLERGVDINPVDSIGASPLMHAIFMGHMPVVEVLLAQEGIPLDHVDSCGRTPLLYAARWSSDLLPLLVCRDDIDVNHTDDEGRSALHYAVTAWDLDAVKLLTRNDIHVDGIDRTGKSPLTHAQDKERDEMAGLLLEHGVRFGLDDYLDQLIARSAPPGGWWKQWSG